MGETDGLVGIPSCFMEIPRWWNSDIHPDVCESSKLSWCNTTICIWKSRLDLRYPGENSHVSRKGTILIGHFIFQPDISRDMLVFNRVGFTWIPLQDLLDAKAFGPPLVIQFL